MSEGGKRLIRIEIQPRAQMDITATLAFTEERWGRRQRAAYRALINGALKDLRRFPDMGKPRDEIFDGCRTLVVGSHLILYHVPDQRVVVVRVLHTSQDPKELIALRHSFA